MAKAVVHAPPSSKSLSKVKPKATKLPSILHPPYLQMITEAISSLKDRTGSSQQAIAKFIEEKYKTGLPPNFKKVLSIQLKKFAEAQKLVKVKNSFKISQVERAKKVAVGNKEKLQKKKGDDKTGVRKEKKSGKVKAINKEGVASTPKSKKSVKPAKAKESVKKSLKTKRLSQVKTPEGMKKKVLTPKRKVTKSITASKPAPKKARN